MAKNKLLSTVYSLNEQIEDLKGPYSSLLESLKNNPEIGEAKFKQIMTILTDTAGGYSTVKDRFEAVEEILAGVKYDVTTIVRPELDEVQEELLTAKGSYSTLKEAIDNAKDNIRIDLSDDEVSVVAEKETMVISKEITVPAGAFTTIGERFDETKGIINYFVKKMEPGETKSFDFKSNKLKSASAEINATATGTSLKDEGEISIDISDGVFIKPQPNVWKYEKDEMLALLGGETLFGTSFGSFFKRPGTKTINDYISTNVHLGVVAIALKKPKYLTKCRVYPYTVKNTTSSFWLVVYGPNNNMIKNEYYKNPTPQNHTNWNAYVDLQINDVVANIIISFEDSDTSGAQSSFGGIEIYTKDIGSIGKAETLDKIYSYENIRRLSDVKVISSDIDDKNSRVRFALKINGVQKIFKPKNLNISYKEFQSPGYTPMLFDTKLQTYNLFQESTVAKAVWASFIRFGSRDNTLMSEEDWTCSRDISYDAWGDGGGDAFDSWGYFQLYFGGNWQRFGMDLGTRSYSQNGLNYTVKNKFISKNLYRMTIESTNSPRAKVQINATGNMGSDGSSAYDQMTYSIAGRPYKIARSYGTADADVFLCVVPSEPLESTIPSYSWSGENFYLNSNAVQLPLTIYVYVGYVGYDTVISGIKYDIENPIVANMPLDYAGIFKNMEEFINKECVITQPFVKKICTKGWEYFKVSSISEGGTGVRYLISFDEGFSWCKYKDRAWSDTGLNLQNIHLGMTADEMLNIPPEAFKERMGEYISIAVYTPGDGYFNSISIDTGNDGIIPIDDVDIPETGMTLPVVEMIDAKSLLKEFKDKEYTMSLSFKIFMENITNKNFNISQIDWSTLQSSYWSLPNEYEKGNINIKVFDEYMEVHNNGTNTTDLKLNYTKPQQMTLIEKGSGQDIKEISEMVNQYRTTEGFVNDIINRTKKSLGFYNYVVNENSLAASKLLISLYTEGSYNHKGDNIYINSLEDQNISVDAEYYTFDNAKHKYIINGSVAPISITTEAFFVPEDSITDIYIQGNATTEPKRIYAILNEEYEVQVLNNTLNLNEVYKSYNKDIKILRVRFEYKSEYFQLEFKGYGVVFLNRKFISDNNRVVIAPQFDGQSIFSIPFYKENENIVRVFVNEVEQEKDIDYVLDFTSNPKLTWISPDFELDKTDKIVVELAT